MKTTKPETLTESIESLRSLDGELRSLRESVASIDRQSDEALNRFERAQRRVEKERAGGFFDESDEARQELTEALSEVQRLDREKDNALERLEALQPERVELIKSTIGPAWESFFLARQREIETGLDLGSCLDELVEDFGNAVGERIEAQRLVDRVLESAGPIIGQRLLDAEKGRKAQPRLEDSSSNRVCWKRATRLLDLARDKGLEHGPILE
jgi:chromosome segregation ATPase